MNSVNNWVWKMFPEAQPEDDGASVWRVAPDGKSRRAVAWHILDEDARLIAAAPAMLDALNEWLGQWTYLQVNWRDMDATEVDQILSQAELAIERVIAKAEGGSE